MEANQCKYNSASDYQQSTHPFIRCWHYEAPHPGGGMCSLERGEECRLARKATAEDQAARDLARV